MKLYYMHGACSLAPHIILRETGLAFTLERVDSASKRTGAGRDYLAVNPKGYVPALELDDGEVLTENVVIQQYLADLAPQSRLAPARGTKERLRLEEWLGFITTELHKSYSPLFATNTPDAYRAIARDKLAARYALVETALAEGRLFLLGQGWTIADIYLFVVTNWAGHVGLDLSKFPRTQAHAERIAGRASVAAALAAERDAA